MSDLEALERLDELGRFTRGGSGGKRCVIPEAGHWDQEDAALELVAKGVETAAVALRDVPPILRRFVFGRRLTGAHRRSYNAN